jgi:hypothetical protein
MKGLTDLLNDPAHRLSSKTIEFMRNFDTFADPDINNIHGEILKELKAETQRVIVEESSKSAPLIVEETSSSVGKGTAAIIIALTAGVGVAAGIKFRKNLNKALEESVVTPRTIPAGGPLDVTPQPNPEIDRVSGKTDSEPGPVGSEGKTVTEVPEGGPGKDPHENQLEEEIAKMGVSIIILGNVPSREELIKTREEILEALKTIARDGFEIPKPIVLRELTKDPFFEERSGTLNLGPQVKAEKIVQFVKRRSFEKTPEQPK